MMQELKDKYGRTFRTLRVSLLQHCNLGCIYCVAGEEELKQANAERNVGLPGSGGLPGNGGLPGSASLSGNGGLPANGSFLAPEDLLAIISRLHGQLKLENIRLTGGEPLLHPHLAELIKGIRAAGIPAVRLTTNGFLLKRQAAALKEAGLEALNVSLDAVDEDVFFRVTRRHSAERIIQGIDAALAAGLDVKLNAVVIKGMNDTQILPLLELAFSRGLRIRFLEVMAMGHMHNQADRYLVPQDEILRIVGQRYTLQPLPREPSATARYWMTDEGHVFGIIANESEPFCRDCDRLRLDSSGRIYGCLSSNQPIALRLEEGEDEWKEKLGAALLQKQPLRFTGSDLSMLRIGG